MFKGLYINLDREIGRRSRMEAEFRRFGLSESYERVDAVKGDVGESAPKRAAIGCFRSHLKALEIGAASGAVVVHILEDDAILSSRLKPFLSSRECDTALAAYDLLFLDMWVTQRDLPTYRRGLAAAGGGLCLMDLRGVTIGATDSYLVPARSIGRVRDLLSEEIGRGPRMPVDTFYREAVASGTLKAAVVLPFLTGIDIDTGTRSSIQILDREEQRRLVMLRTAFFIEPERQPSLKLPPLPARPT